MESLATRGVERSRALGLTAISLGFLMITLDATIVNVALGPIGSDLGGGAAALMPRSLALVAHTFPDSRERRRALGLWGGASGIGLAAGPVLGGVVTAALGWRAILLVNLPITAAAAELLRRHVGETPRHRHPLDLPGQIIAIAGLAALTGGFIIAGSRGWDARLTLGLLIAGVAGAGAFALVERAVEHPMIDPDLFRERTFSVAVALGVIFNFCLYGSIFCLAIDLRRVHGLDALGTGLALLPMMIVTGAMAFLSGRLVARIGEWDTIVVGLAAGVSGALLVSLAATGGVTTLIVSSVPIGVTALAMPAMTAVAMRHAPPGRIGLASGVFNASRQTGGALGVAVLGALLAGGSGDVSEHAAFLATAGAYSIGIVLALIGRSGS